MAQDIHTIGVADTFDYVSTEDGEEGHIGLVSSNGERFRLAIPYNFLDPLSLQLLRLKALVETYRKKLGKGAPTQVRTLEVSHFSTEIDASSRTVALHLNMAGGSHMAFALSPASAEDMARVMRETADKLANIEPRKPS